MGFDDDERTDAVDEANKFMENQRKEAELKKAETIAQMQKNREDNELVKQLSEAMGYRQQQEDIDHLKNGFAALQQSIQIMVQSLQGLKTEIEKTNNVVNQQSQIIMSANQTAAGIPNAPNEQKLLQLAELGKQLGEIYKVFKGDPQPQLSLIPQEVIHEKMVKGFYDNLETGESINDFIKSALKKSVTKNIVQNSLKTIGDVVDSSHGPS